MSANNRAILERIAEEVEDPQMAGQLGAILELDDAKMEALLSRRPFIAELRDWIVERGAKDPHDPKIPGFVDNIILEAMDLDDDGRLTSPFEEIEQVDGTVLPRS